MRRSSRRPPNESFAGCTGGWGFPALELAAALPVMQRAAVCSVETAPLAEAAGFTVLLNPQPVLGQSHSLRLGLAACRESDGCLFLTGDQPFLSVETLHRLINAWEKEPGGIWGCDFEGRFSIPSIFPAAVYGELLTQDGDVGGREVMRAHPELVHTIPAPPQEHFDIDTVADLTAAQQK